jgi:hypothetical protein
VQVARELGADAARGAGDQDDLAAQIHARRSVSVLAGVGPHALEQVSLAVAGVEDAVQLAGLKDCLVARSHRALVLLGDQVDDALEDVDRGQLVVEVERLGRAVLGEDAVEGGGLCGDVGERWHGAIVRAGGCGEVAWALRVRLDGVSHSERRTGSGERRLGKTQP